MSVWFCIPSARPAAEANPILEKWRERGYKIALWRDTDAGTPICDLLLIGAYPGYTLAVNALVKEVLQYDPACDWVVTGGDDTEPDPIHSAEEIARQCSRSFGGTFGVMQPTGDPWADRSIERICGSPWLGREFCERANGGRGPLWPEYYHNFEDEELQQVAIKLGVLWQRRDLIHLHHHWTRQGDRVQRAHECPAFLERANSAGEWIASQRLFESRRAAGFPGHEPLPAAAVIQR